MYHANSDRFFQVEFNLPVVNQVISEKFNVFSKKLLQLAARLRYFSLKTNCGHAVARIVLEIYSLLALRRDMLCLQVVPIKVFDTCRSARTCHRYI